ncbi:D-mannonate dehydratase [Anaerosolibacter carboniphilus]|uniref:D-mannonate dehydratase n=1 Tax=Anaerosolibacter carboniphilus TaxID=1417629 RepID=A0A841KYE4_9FIRM|nr:D-mannonate dehydratase [Anaerosolibacter carboniphilus]
MDANSGGFVLPGSGLYDRALRAAYLLGLWEATEKPNKK